MQAACRAAILKHCRSRGVQVCELAPPTSTTTSSSTTTTTVLTGVIERIEVTPATPTLVVGTPRQFTATAFLSDGTSRNVTELVSWASSSEARTSVSNAAGSKGLAQTAAADTAAISATDPATGIIGQTSTLYRANYFLGISGVSLNGQGTAVDVAPGSAVTVSLRYTIWSRIGCPACIDWIVIGIGGSGKDAHHVGIPGTYPGESGSVTFDLTAPATAGWSTVYALLVPDYTKGSAIGHYDSWFPSGANFIPIGTLRVEG
jgi:hypothetical protein